MHFLLIVILAQSPLGAEPNSLEPVEQLRMRLEAASANAGARQALVEEYLAGVPDSTERHRRCLEFAQTQELVQVKLELRNSWGESITGVMIEDGEARALLPITLLLPRCLEYVTLREPGGTEDYRATIAWGALDGYAAATLRGPQSFWELSALAQISWVNPGWRTGPQLHGSGGVRLAMWRHWIQADLAIKASTFSSRYWSIPGNVAVDAFVAFPVTFDLTSWQLRGSFGAGVWSTICPSLRLAVSALRGRFVGGLTAGLHLYPQAFEPFVASEPTIGAVPFAYFLFWAVGVSFGVRLD